MSHLTPQQYATLKAAILADPVLAAKPNTSGGAQEIAAAFNAQASPAFTVWKTNVSIGAVGDAMVSSELATRSTADNTRLQTIAQFAPEGINPSRADRRAAFDDIFSGVGGAGTRTALLALWKRTATRFEKLYATGTGSDAAPAQLVLEGAVSSDEVQQARES